LEVLTSIIVITRNSARTLSTCLDSLVNQTFPSEQVELIVVDGGSTDGTVDFCGKYPVKIIKLSKWGIPYQRNIGVQHSRGEYVAFLDSDDVARPFWIEKTLQYFKNHNQEPIAAVGCSHTLLNPQGDFVRIAWLEHAYRQKVVPEAVHHLGASGSVFKRSIIKEVGGFDNSLLTAEDMDLCSRIVRAGYLIYFQKEPLIEVEYPDRLTSYLRKQIKNVAYMVIFYFKPSSIRHKQGSYSNYRDYIQGILPPFFILACIFLPNSGRLLTCGIGLMVLIVLNSPLLRFVLQKGQSNGLGKFWLFKFYLYCFLRSLAWSAGLAEGIFLTLRQLVANKVSKKPSVE
jgi:glycosyltransferase involved in cell wall biosynthesis